MTDNNESTETTDSVPASKSPAVPMSAREKAEARRKRIMQASKRRLRAVGGEDDVEADNNAINESSNAPNSTEITESNTNNASEIKADDTTENQTSKKSTLSGQARLQQMRRRRFKKAAAATPSAQKPTENVEDVKTDTNDKENKEESNVEVQKTETEPVEMNENQNTNSDDSETMKHSSSYTTLDGQQKKYLGVAKMRRKMLSEKKLRDEQKLQDQKKYETDPSGQPINTQDATTIIMNKQIRQAYTIQFFILILLFLSGYQLGVKNAITSNAIHINTNMAIKHESYFVNRLLRNNIYDENVASFSDTKFYELQNEHDVNTYDDNHEEYDEFSSFDSTESPSFTIDPNKNIDPIFRVNLDLYTQGSGLLFLLARQAVKFHRFWVITIPSFLFSFVTFSLCPPLLFILAICIRRGIQILMHNLVGMKTLSDLLESESNLQMKDLAGEEPSKDLVDMATSSIKKMVTGFVPSSFWILWDCWWMLRKDLFIVLFGFLLGFILPGFDMRNICFTGSEHNEL